MKILKFIFRKRRSVQFCSVCGQVVGSYEHVTGFTVFNTWQNNFLDIDMQLLTSKAGVSTVKLPPPNKSQAG